MDRRSLELIGVMFEKQVVMKLKEDFPDAKILHNVNSFSDCLHKETQTDTIMISSCGIFVIESKNFITSMKGSYNDRYWELRSRDKKAKFVFNSFHQNLIHIRSLNASLQKKFNKLPIHMWNLVCFPDSTFLNTDMKEVCHISDLSNKIRERFDITLNLDVNAYESMFRKINTDELNRQAEIYGLADTRVTHFRPRDE